MRGRFLEPSRLRFNEIVARLKAQGCDSVILGCTEIPLLVRADDCPLPTLDSTRLLARAPVLEAIGGSPFDVASASTRRTRASASGGRSEPPPLSAERYHRAASVFGPCWMTYAILTAIADIRI